VLAAPYLLEPVHLRGVGRHRDASLHRLVLSSSTGAALALRLQLCGRGARAAARGIGRQDTAVAGSLAALSSFAVEGHTALD